jgi:hypothetical protein
MFCLVYVLITSGGMSFSYNYIFVVKGKAQK